MDTRGKKQFDLNTNRNEILKHLNPNYNTKLSSLKGCDLQELLLLLDNYYLTLRDKLGLKSDVTFGLELEFEYISSFVKSSTIDNELKKYLLMMIGKQVRKLQLVMVLRLVLRL